MIIVKIEEIKIIYESFGRIILIRLCKNKIYRFIKKLSKRVKFEILGLKTLTRAQRASYELECKKQNFKLVNISNITCNMKNTCI